MFKFKSYSFDPTNYTASFNYENQGIEFQEQIKFAKSKQALDSELLDRALFLCFILIGTSYYKAHPTNQVQLDAKIDEFQAHFFNQVYQEGLSQFAFENHLTRDDLAHFEPDKSTSPAPLAANGYQGILSLQSGGKDSLLTSNLIKKQSPSFLYVSSSSDHYPAILDMLPGPLQLIERRVDHESLRQAGGLNGHVPITYIIQSLALVQAIINHQNIVLTSIGREGNEPHAHIGDLAVNHQWSKTWAAEELFAAYAARYISPDLHIGSPLRGFSELKIAQLFVEHCWPEFGHKFSSCNVANYRQGQNNRQLTWCGECAKCANTYLLFAPFVERTDLDSLYGGESLFAKSSLTDTFKGLLGIDGFMKPFECVGEIAELRRAYVMRLPEYPDLPFAVPPSDFDYEKISAMQPFIKALLAKIKE